MRRRRSRLALLVLTALAAAGCGTSSSTPTSAGVPVPATTSTPPVTTPPPTTTTQATTTTTTTTTATTNTTTTPTTTTTAPTTSTATATTPLPPAPAGLKAAVGYSSYDNCQGTCTGSVPASLRRALHLPGLAPGGACLISGLVGSYAGPAVGKGPVYAAEPTPLPITSFVNSAWEGGRVTWIADQTYAGPVLIRGGQVGGPGAVGFGEGHVPVDELQLLTASTTSSGEPPGIREWPTFTRVRSPGCYAYQVDGTNFSEVIVFQAS